MKTVSEHISPLQLLLAGDTMLGRGVNEVIKRVGPTYPLESLVSLTRTADLFFVNLECAISPQDLLYSGPPKRFYFRADPIVAETLTYAGVDLVSLANNHALDADYDGLRDTLDILDKRGIAHVGAGKDIDTASHPALIEVKGLRLGVLGYCDHQDDFAAGVNQPGIRYVDLSDPDTPIMLAREVKALASRVDHVIIAFHWQPNWVLHVSEFNRYLAQHLVKAGARIIWGHSPHHFQGVEWIGDSVVLYSSGDFVDDYAVNPQFHNDRQLLFQLVLSDRSVARIRAYPIELEYAWTHAAGTEARQWIVRHFARMCAEVDSRVEEQDEWIEILPD